MPLDPIVKTLIDALAELNLPSWDTLAPPRRGNRCGRSHRSARRKMLRGSRIGRSQGPNGPIPVRIQQPQGETPIPVLVYFHGGGWVICDIAAAPVTVHRYNGVIDGFLSMAAMLPQSRAAIDEAAGAIRDALAAAPASK